MRAKPCIGIIAVFSTLLLTISACGDDKSSSPKALPDEVADKADSKPTNATCPSSAKKYS